MATFHAELWQLRENLPDLQDVNMAGLESRVPIVHSPSCHLASQHRLAPEDWPNWVPNVPLAYVEAQWRREEDRALMRPGGFSEDLGYCQLCIIERRATA